MDIEILDRKELVDPSGHPLRMRADGKPVLLRPDGKPILSSNDIYAPRIYCNTRYFRRAALHFMKYGCYTRAKPGTKEYHDFWKRETNKCIEGVWHGGLWITGKHYFYLNYLQIKKVPCRDYLEIHPLASKNRKVETFPDFWEVDLRWWYTKELTVQNAENSIEQGHIVCLKTRRGGFSFKEAGDGAWNYTFLKNSMSTYYAFSDTYLVEDGIFNKVHKMLNFLNQHTHWSQVRKITDNLYHKVGSYKIQNSQGVPIIKGRQNELIAQVLDDPEKARGGDCVKVTFEEFGSFKGGLKAWQVCMPQVKQGSVITGHMTAFGTGNNSDNDGYIEALEEMFYNPITYDCVSFDNIWDEGMEGTECGFFVPTTEIRTEFSDVDGNLDRTAATNAVIAERKKKEGTKGAQLNTIENPMCPQEALTRVKSQLFDIEYTKKAKRKLETSGRLDHLTHVEFEGSFDKPQYKILAATKGYTEYPVKEDHDKSSCVVISEHPYRREDDSTPDDMYFAVHDPYSKDVAESSASIGSCYIVKRVNRIDGARYDKIVAWYNARPDKRLDYNKQMFLLISYYNAKLQFEIDGGGQGVVEYATSRKHYLVDKLYTEPEMLHNKELAGRSTNKSYGIKISVGKRAEVFLEYLSDLLMDVVAIDESGEEILFVDTIDDIGLLNEIIRYKEGANVDRLSSTRLIPMMLRELEAIEVEEKDQDPNSFFNRPLYSNEQNNTIFAVEQIRTY